VSANNRIVWSGMAELKAQLRQLPAHLTNEAHGIVTAAAMSAYGEIYAAYPEVTGNLKAGLAVDTGAGMKASSRALGANAVLVNRAKHAWLYDNGTGQRRSSTHANLGSMTPTHVFVRAAMKHRRAMYERLIWMLEQEGLRVRGSIDAAA
jgi:hypothetical protein